MVRVSIVIPAYEESASIGPVLARIEESCTIDHEILVVVDSPDDSTLNAIADMPYSIQSVKVLVQSYGRGPANAIRFGIDNASADCVVVTMADGCDDASLIDELVRLVERGCVIAAASRYMPGGQQVGGPRFKKFLSASAGKSLNWFAGAGTRDATNSFKAYSREFVQQVGIDSRQGFEIGIELVAKARRLRKPIAELPTIWLDRDAGTSNFQLTKWLPEYLRWYTFAYGPKLNVNQVRNRSAGKD